MAHLTPDDIQRWIDNRFTYAQALEDLQCIIRDTKPYNPYKIFTGPDWSGVSQ